MLLRFGQVVLIIQKENTLVAEEVKALTKSFMIPHHESITYQKIKLLFDAIDHFVNSKNFKVRFDLINYELDGNQWD